MNMKRELLSEYIDHIKNIIIAFDCIQSKIIKRKGQPILMDDYRIILKSHKYILDEQNITNLEDEILHNLHEFHNSPLLYVAFIVDIISIDNNNEWFAINRFDENMDIKDTLISDIWSDALGCIIYLIESECTFYNSLDTVNKKLLHIVYAFIQMYNNTLHFLSNKCNVLDCDIRSFLQKNNIYMFEYDENYKLNLNKVKNTITPFILPPRLNTEIANKYYTKALNANLITIKGQYLKRNEKRITKALLAYLTDRIHCDNINSVYPETALNKLFNETRLGKARSQYIDNKNAYGKPIGYEIIDKLFEE